MRKLSLAISLAAVALLITVAIYAARRSAHSVATKSANTSAKAAPDNSTDGAESVIQFVKDPEPLPAVQMKDIDGNVISPSSFAGKVVLLSFWATWCSPCRAEIPELIKLQSQYKDRLQIIGLSVDDSGPQKVKEFAAKEGMNYPIVMADEAITEKFGGVPALPTNFVVNTQGRVVQKHVGLYPIGVYDQEIRALLNMPVQAKIETFVDTGQVFLKNAANATELPDVDLSKLTPDQKKLALKEMNAQNCTCGCTLTIAQCRINDTECDRSKELAAKIVKAAAKGESINVDPPEAKTVQN